MAEAADSEQPPEHDKVASVRRLALVFTAAAAAECSSVGSVRVVHLGKHNTVSAAR